MAVIIGMAGILGLWDPSENSSQEERMERVGINQDIPATTWTPEKIDSMMKEFHTSEEYFSELYFSIPGPADSLENELIVAVDMYLQENHPNTLLTAEALVNKCLENQFDICFALAQAEIESACGTRGVASKTHSPWNVGAWDGRSHQQMRSLGYGYSHPDESITPYIELVTSQYLGEDKDFQDLLGHYVNQDGHRYASDPRYEHKLRRQYRKIQEATRIGEMQKDYQEQMALYNDLACLAPATY